MITKLPFSNDPSQIFVTQLDDVKYQFKAKFNDRSGVWTVDMSNTTTLETMLEGIPLVLGQDLLEPYNFDIGRLIVVDESGQGIDASVEDLGSRVNVYWISPDEVLP